MGRFTNSVLVYIGAIVLLVGLASAGSFLYEPVAENSPWATLGILTLLAAVSHLYPVKSARQGAAYVLANTFLFAAVLLVPGWMLTILCTGARLPMTIQDRMRAGAWTRYVFNSAQSALAGLAAWAIVVWGSARDLGGLIDLLWVLVALAVFVTLQLFLVAGIIAVNRKVGIWRLEVFTAKAFLADSLTPFLGVIMAALWHLNPWVLGLAAVPLLVVYRLMRQIQLVTQVDMDPKTGLYNFRYFQQAAQEEIRRSAKLRRPVSVLFCDMDYLRDVNNTYGHLAGDRVLEQLAGLLTRALPSTSVIGRFGGEEFVVLMPGTDREQASYLAEKLRAAVKDYPFQIGTFSPISVTVSIGVAGSPEDGTTPEVLLNKADRAVYNAKHLGRNRVCLYDDSLAASPAGTIAGAAAPVGAAPLALPRPVPAAAPEPAVPADPAVQPAGVRSESPSDRPRLAVIAAGLIAAGVGLGGLNAGYPWLALGVCLLLGAAAEFMPIHILTAGGRAASFSPSIAVSLATGALLGPSGAVVVGLGNAFAHTVRTQSYRPIRTAFNAAVIVLTNSASGWLFQWASVPGSPRVTSAHLATAVAATAVSFLVNTGLLTLVMGRRDEQPVLGVWWRSFGWLAPHFLFMGVNGVSVLFAFREVGLAGAVVATVPLVVVGYSFSQSIAGHTRSLEQVRRAHAELHQAHLKQARTLEELIEALSSVIDARDYSISGHSRQVSRYAVAIAREMKLPEKEIGNIRLASLLHDLGKMGVPEAILHKPSSLTPLEWETVREHAALGERILRQITALDDVARMVGEHHERFDGHGYPAGRPGSKISIGARMIAVADTLDTIISGRPYAAPRPLAWALSELTRCAGSQFDPAVVEALTRVVDKKGPEFFRPTGSMQDPQANAATPA